MRVYTIAVHDAGRVVANGSGVIARNYGNAIARCSDVTFNRVLSYSAWGGSDNRPPSAKTDTDYSGGGGKRKK